MYDRIRDQQTRILESLRAAGQDGAFNYALSEISLRYGAVLKNLRDVGHQITTVPVDRKAGLWKYVYRGFDERITTKKAVTSPASSSHSNAVPVLADKLLHSVAGAVNDVRRFCAKGIYTLGKVIPCNRVAVNALGSPRCQEH